MVPFSEENEEGRLSGRQSLSINVLSVGYCQNREAISIRDIYIKTSVQEQNL